jgi:hypothetical protein
MADEKNAQEQSTPQPRHSAAPAPAKAQPATGAGKSGTFGDGSTQEQQDAQIKAAEEANAETKRLADAEREARSQ